MLSLILLFSVAVAVDKPTIVGVLSCSLEILPLTVVEFYYSRVCIVLVDFSSGIIYPFVLLKPKATTGDRLLTTKPHKDTEN